MAEKACRSCKSLCMGSICHICKSTNLSEDWSGLLIIVDADKSEIAKKMGINKSGRYAIRVR